jgi:hypothetical protein
MASRCGAAALAALCLLAAVPAHAATQVRGSVNISVGGYYGPRFGAYVGPYWGPRWHAGYWHHGWYGPRYGWWWVVGPSWYYYPEPVYPYPPVVIEREVQTLPSAPGPAPQATWYYCDAAKAYYPYVSSCPGGWRAVPATPPQ